jgi:hypothetical protein
VVEVSVPAVHFIARLSDVPIKPTSQVTTHPGAPDKLLSDSPGDRAFDSPVFVNRARATVVEKGKWPAST